MPDVDDFGNPIDDTMDDTGFADDVPLEDDDTGGPFSGGGFFGRAGGLVRTAIGSPGGGFPARGVAGGVMGNVGRVAGNLVYSLAGRVRGIVARSGEFFTSKRVADLAQRFGLEMAAAGLGVALLDVAQAVFSHHRTRRHRRGRGISGADMRRCSRTIKKRTRFHHQLSTLAAQGHRSRSRSHAPASGRETTILQR